jgi:hypothetical protein
MYISGPEAENILSIKNTVFLLHLYIVINTQFQHILMNCFGDLTFIYLYILNRQFS